MLLSIRESDIKCKRRRQEIIYVSLGYERVRIMEITYLGHSSFKIRGKNAVVVTDPYREDMVGLKFPKHLSCDIVCVSHSHEDHSMVSTLEGTPFVVNGPGEYEVKGVGIVGIPVYHDTEKGAKRGKNTMYRLEVDGVAILHAGDLGHSLTDSDLEHVGSVDILLIPVGGFYTIDSREAAAIVHDIDPAIVIPMHFGRPELNQKAFGNLTPVSVFLKEMGKVGISPQAKLSVTKDKLPDEMQVIVLE